MIYLLLCTSLFCSHCSFTLLYCVFNQSSRNSLKLFVHNFTENIRFMIQYCLWITESMLDNCIVEKIFELYIIKFYFQCTVVYIDWNIKMIQMLIIYLSTIDHIPQKLKLSSATLKNTIKYADKLHFHFNIGPFLHVYRSFWREE